MRWHASVTLEEVARRKPAASWRLSGINSPLCILAVPHVALPDELQGSWLSFASRCAHNHSVRSSSAWRSSSISSQTSLEVASRISVRNCWLVRSAKRVVGK